MRVALDARHAARGLGIATFVCNLARELAGFDELELVWLGAPEQAPPGPVRCVDLARLPYPVLDGPAGRAIVRRLGVDLIHFTGNTGWARRGPVPSLLTLHDLIFMAAGRRRASVRQAVGHRYEQRLIPRALAAADAIVVPSATVAAAVRGRFGEPSQLHVVHEGVDPVADAEAGVPAGERARRSVAPYLVAFAGRDPRKRTADVVAAWRSLGADRQAPPLGLQLLASAGLPPGIGEALAADVSAGTVVIHGHLPRSALSQILAGAFALLYPSADEGFGLPVLEGMAAGTPVLSGLAPATREVGGAAIVPLDATDVAGSITAAVRRLRDDPAARRRVIELGRAHAATFSWRRTATAYLELYRTVLERR